MEFIQKYYQRFKWKIILIVGGVSVLVCLSCFLLFINKNEKAVPEIQELGEQTQETTTVEETVISKNEEEQLGYVDLKGAVKKPGMYKIKENMRVLEVVECAGGFTDEANEKQVNFSQKVRDQMVIYVPKEGEEEKEQLTTFSDESETATEKEGKVNINTADLSSLMTVNGIGQKKAEEIIRYREEHGSFQNVDELTNVSGIGQKTFESLKDSITIK